MQGNAARVDGQSGEIEEVTILEVGDVNIEVGQSFEEREVAKYIERRGGMEEAISTLSAVAHTTPTAKKMYQIALEWQKKVLGNEHQEKIDQAHHASPYSPVPNKKQQGKLEPKEQYSKMLNQLGLSHAQVVAVDEQWKPIVNVEYHHGRANINGTNVWFPARFKGFMGANVLRKHAETVPMHLVNTKEDHVVAIPDEQRYKKMKKDQQTIDVEEFKGVVSVLGEGVNMFPFIALDVVNKNVFTPRKYDIELLTKPGVWTFSLIEEMEDRVYVKPVEYQEKLSHVIKAHVSVKDGGELEITCDEIPGDIRIPQRFQRKLRQLPGNWILKVLDFKKFKVIAEPFKYAEPRKPKQQRPMRLVDQRPPRVTNELANDRLKSLMSTGKVCL